MTQADIKIIYEDQAVVVVNKPAGVLSTLLGWLPVGYQNAHRLDRDTSGVLVVAKTQEALEHLQNQFRHRAVEKVYFALTHGVIKADEGLIEAPIGRSRRDPRRRVAHQKAFGRLREARTNFFVRERLPGHTLVELRPETGRTHQIRVHLKSIGHPIIGDALYAGNLPDVLPVRRQMLHAARIKLALPGRSDRSAFAAPLPADFVAALDYLREL